MVLRREIFGDSGGDLFGFCGETEAKLIADDGRIRKEGQQHKGGAVP